MQAEFKTLLLPKEEEMARRIRTMGDIISAADLKEIGFIYKSQAPKPILEAWGVPFHEGILGAKRNELRIRKKDLMAVFGVSRLVPLRYFRPFLGTSGNWSEKNSVAVEKVGSHETIFVNRLNVFARFIHADLGPEVPIISAPIPPTPPAPAPTRPALTDLEKIQKDFVLTVDALYESFQEDRQRNSEQMRIVFGELALCRKGIERLLAAWEGTPTA